MVELKHHPGIVELPRCHERQQRVMCNQSHGVPEPGGQRSVPARRKMTLHENLLHGALRSSESGVPTNNGRLILEASDKWGDELSSAAVEGDGSSLDDEDSPGPDVRARLEDRTLRDRL